jgi:phosphopantetheinyl transferase
MGDLPQMSDTVRLPVRIPIHPGLRDHHVEGRIVLPAVEALQVLAETFKRFREDLDVATMTKARFDKFLYIEPGAAEIQAFVDIDGYKNGDITARLLTRSRSHMSSITRIKEHASVRYPRQKPVLENQPLDMSAALEGVCVEIPRNRIYRELVPFGPTYHNIRDTLLISKDGAIAEIGAPPNLTLPGDAGYLGSPFPLDAAFHAACVWGQRYERTVAFPVEIEQRRIIDRTRPAETYFCRILPAGKERDRLIFHIWIYDEDGRLREVAFGVHMRDVSSGRMKPPGWLMEKGDTEPLAELKHRCHALSLIELKTLMPFAGQTLSELEQKRYKKMGNDRGRSYLSARLACKRISRTLSGNDMQTPASGITTVSPPDLVRPCCLPAGGSSALSCSVSHDRRFAIGVAADARVGVDVERMSGRVLKSLSLYMNEEEQGLLHRTKLDKIEAATRIWSIKEAAAKALDIPLADSWNRIRVTVVGPYESTYQIDDGPPVMAIHDVVGEHVFTLVYRL